MRQTDENYVSMCKAVADVLEKHEAVWTPTVAFKNQVTRFRELMAEVETAMQGTEIVSTGATADKTKAELDAVKLAVKLAKRGSTYAMEENNMELHDQLRVTKSTLLRRPDTMTVTKLRDIHERLNAIVADLADYDVTSAELTTLATLIDAFDTLVSRPRTLIVERKGYNQEEIPGLLAAIREVLYKMDSLINIFEDTVLEREYKDARIVIDLGGSGGGDAPPPTP